MKLKFEHDTIITPGMVGITAGKRDKITNYLPNYSNLLNIKKQIFLLYLLQMGSSLKSYAHIQWPFPFCPGKYPQKSKYA